MCQLVKMVAVCQSIGSSSKTDDFQRCLKVLICWLSSPVAEATEGGFKCSVSVKVNVSVFKAQPGVGRQQL